MANAKQNIILAHGKYRIILTILRRRMLSRPAGGDTPYHSWCVLAGLPEKRAGKGGTGEIKTYYDFFVR